MITIKKQRDRTGAFSGSLLGDNGRYYTEQDLYLEDGTPAFEFTLVEMSDEEAAMVAAKAAQFEIDDALNNLREKRNELIAETDWWAMSDRTISPEQAAYRQALRDITTTYSSLEEVVWPVKP